MAVFTDCTKKAFNVGMHSDIYELIFFNFGVMKDTIGLYIFILVSVVLSFIQGH